MLTNRGLIIIGSYFGVVNIGSAGLFYYDKQQAINKKWRVRESTLQLSGLIGGWIGGCFAMEQFKHKRAKQSFKNVYFTAVAGNIGIIGATVLAFKKFPHVIPYQIRSFFIKDTSNIIRPSHFQGTQQTYRQPKNNYKQQQQQQQQFEMIENENINNSNNNNSNNNKKRRGRKSKQN